MSRNKTPKGALPYLINLRNGRVMVATEAKLARKDENGEPYFVPCATAAGPEPAKVSVAAKEAAPMVEAPAADEPAAKTPGSSDLLTAIMSTEDKDELVKFGKQLDIKLSKAMKPSTMQAKLSVRLQELAALK